LLPIRAREGIKTHARDDSLLIDLGQLKRIISLDAKARSATIQSAVRGRELNAALAKSGLAFPVGHCPTVSLSGFLLNGGLGWEFWRLGPRHPLAREEADASARCALRGFPSSAASWRTSIRHPHRGVSRTAADCANQPLADFEQIACCFRPAHAEASAAYAGKICPSRARG
jgi:hypothetical protein